jgi:hypothetical protein
LLDLYWALPASSPARPGLLVFLTELRGLMDGAYQLAQLGAAPLAQERLAYLVHGAQSAARDMAETTERHFMRADERGLEAELALRVDVMRALARDLNDS